MYDSHQRRYSEAIFQCMITTTNHWDISQNAFFYFPQEKVIQVWGETSGHNNNIVPQKHIKDGKHISLKPRWKLLMWTRLTPQLINSLTNPRPRLEKYGNKTTWSCDCDSIETHGGVALTYERRCFCLCGICFCIRRPSRTEPCFTASWNMKMRSNIRWERRRLHFTWLTERGLLARRVSERLGKIRRGSEFLRQAALCGSYSRSHLTTGSLFLQTFKLQVL